MKSNINWLMVLISAIGGLVAFIIGEIIINLYQYSINQSVLIGIYFGILSLCIGLSCLIAEIIYPRINGRTWRTSHLGTSIKFLIPCTLIITFIAAMFFQFLYGISLNKNRTINDVVVIMDTSGSMAQTDPNNERYDALKNLLDSLDTSNRTSVYEFSDHTEQVQVMDYLTPKVNENIMLGMEKYKTPTGQTNMKEALDKAIEEINNTKEKGRNAMVIMLSDGGDNFNLDTKFKETMKPFNDNNVPVYTIGMAAGNNFSMLKKISEETKGNYSNVQDVKDIKNAFVKIYKDTQQRLLNGVRYGTDNNIFYGLLRVLFITFLGVIISAGVSFMFDNKYLLKGFIMGGVVSGIIAGMILEIGFGASTQLGFIFRMMADLIIAIVFTLFATSEIYKDKEYKGNTTFSKKSYSDKNKVNSLHSFD